VLSAIAGITVLAWAYMAYEARAMYETGTCQCAGMKMSGPDTNASSPATLFPLFLMWAEMMVAMMLPTAAPMILAFTALQRQHSPETQPYGRTAFFTAGYLLVWTGFSVVAAVTQWALNAWDLLSPMMESANRIFAGCLLLVAGLFQFVRLKTSCLARCRSRQNYLATGWRNSGWGSLAMGWDHGLQCTGCCWMLMALLFVGGVMNLWWIAFLSTFVLIEKVVPRVGYVTRFSGILLAAWGTWTLLS